MRKLLVTNGDSAVGRLRAAGIEAPVLPWRDALHDGPVPRTGSLEELSAVRAEFLGAAFGHDPAEVRASFSERDGLVRRHGDFDCLELWFEHDLYDQLQLLQVLHAPAGRGRRRDVFLVQAGDHLGLQPADSILALGRAAAPVTDRQFDLAARVWNAFTAPDPQDLAARLDADLAPFGYLRSALVRLLSELPDTATGLSLTEARILEALAAGLTRPWEIFKAVSEAEEARWMGDASFFMRLDALAFTPHPPIEGLPGPFPFRAPRETHGCGPEAKAYVSAQLRLTPFGREVVAGRADHARANPRETWLGGTRLEPGRPWRFDRGALRLQAP